MSKEITVGTVKFGPGYSFGILDAHDKVLRGIKQKKTHPEAMTILESLTPGGSEFVGDPERCLVYIRDRVDRLEKLLKRLVRERKELKNTNSELLTALGELLRMAEAWQTDFEALASDPDYVPEFNEETLSARAVIAGCQMACKKGE